MEYCKYHPLVPATYECSNCATTQCDTCVDELSHRRKTACFVCDQEVESLGAVYTAVPFWRRLQESFRYPLRTQTMILIVGVAFLTHILSFVGSIFVIAWYLAVVGSFCKYCLSCLDNTAKGSMQAPDINEAYGGGFGIALKLIVLIGAIVLVVILAAHWGGAAAAQLLGVVLVAGLPAMLIRYAITGDFAETLNPLNMVLLILAIGLPYGLLLSFIMIMLASVSVLHEIIGENTSFLTSMLQSIISNYYMVVVFHIMGYMVFQYQGALGFAAREDSGEDESRTEKDVLLAKIDVLLKEGDFDEVYQLYQRAIKKYSKDRNIYNRLADFLLATKHKEFLEEFASTYLKFLLKNNESHKLNVFYKQVLHILPNFIPTFAEVRYALAKICYEGGDPRSTVKLINGMHKMFRGFEELPEAYILMAKALGDFPNMEARAKKCRELAGILEKKRPKKQPKQTEEKSKGHDEGANVEDDSAEPSDNTNGSPKDDDKKDLPPIDFVL